MRRVGLVLALMVCVATGSPGQETLFEELTPRVTAVLQPPTGWVNDSNAVIVATDQGTVVVDAPSDPETVRRTIARIDALDRGGVRFLVNTHWHSDHTQGNQLYRERYGGALSILGHATLRTDVPERAGAFLEEQRSRLAELIPKAEGQLELGLSLGGEPLDEAQQEQQRQGIAAAREQLAALTRTRLSPPEVTYDEGLTLHLGDTEIRLLHFAAHTDGDTLLYLPAEKLLLSGDVVDVMPFAGHGHLGRWIAALDRLASLDIERIVPGHGPVFEGTTQIELLRRYFTTILDGARAAVARGETLEQAQQALDLTELRREMAGDNEMLQRNFDAFAPETIARAYAEVRGES